MTAAATSRQKNICITHPNTQKTIFPVLRTFPPDRAASLADLTKYATMNGALSVSVTQPMTDRTNMIGGDTNIMMTTGVKMSRKKMAMSIPPTTKYGMSPYFRISAAPSRYRLSILRPQVTEMTVFAMERASGNMKYKSGNFEFSVPEKLLRKLFEMAKRSM